MLFFLYIFNKTNDCSLCLCWMTSLFWLYFLLDVKHECSDIVFFLDMSCVKSIATLHIDNGFIIEKVILSRLWWYLYNSITMINFTCRKVVSVMRRSLWNKSQPTLFNMNYVSIKENALIILQSRIETSC